MALVVKPARECSVCDIYSPAEPVLRLIDTQDALVGMGRHSHFPLKDADKVIRTPSNSVSQVADRYLVRVTRMHVIADTSYRRRFVRNACVQYALVRVPYTKISYRPQHHMILLQDSRSSCQGVKCKAELIRKFRIVNCSRSKLRRTICFHLLGKFVHIFRAYIEIAVNPAAIAESLTGVRLAGFDEVRLCGSASYL